MEDEKRISYASIVSKSSEQLLLIITDIINIATLEAGKEIVKESLVDINQLMQTLFEQFESSAQSKNISFKCELIPDSFSSEIYSDQIKITAILSNLINNAIKFTKDGFVNFGCQLKNNFLEFYVSDSGIGVPSDKQELIFKRFMQVENTVARKYGGTGLGLSISKSYIEMLGGKIWLISELDKGTSFYFTVPYKISRKKETHISTVKREVKLKIQFQKTILVAEDEDNNFALINELLSNTNLIVLRAINGVDAVEKCKTNRIDLVLMDIKMPEMDGYEATRQIRTFAPELPIVAQTAYTIEKDIMRIMESGFNDYLSKPLNKNKMFALINKYTNQNEQSDLQ